MATPASGLRMAEYQLGDLAMVWWLGQHAPWSDQSNASSIAALAGHAIDDGGRWLDAAQLSSRWRAEIGDTPSEPLDGYHVSVVYEQAKRLTVGVDLLGFFPVYYWNENGILLAASSCRLLAAHPAYRLKSDLQGIVGMLMINGLVANRTLLSGVRRLAPGHRLVAEPSPAGGYAAREQFQYRVRGRDRYQQATFEELVEIVDGAMRRAVARHTPPAMKTVQLVSGGLDSRIVTGYIKDAKLDCSGICLGQPHDFEARAAAAACEALDFPFRVVRKEVEPKEFVERAKERVCWLHLSAGIGTGELTDADSVLQESAACYWSGISLDALLGGLSYNSGYDAATGGWSFAGVIADAAKWGLNSTELAKLLRTSDAVDLVAAIWREFEREYHQHDDLPHRLVFHSRMYNRHRYHLGNTLWQLSFASWPLLFIADRAWLETLIDVPPPMIMNKRLEKELLRRKFPQLVNVPIDVNSWHHGWVSPTRRQRARARLNKIVPIERVWNDLYWRKLRGIERRRYWRYYDFDLPKWRAVRQAAEPLRDRLSTWFHPQEVNRLLPPADAKLPKNDAFGDAASRRNLLGLAMWSDLVGHAS
jgi:asparagine synthase (glutamine-hydrolysing)